MKSKSDFGGLPVAARSMIILFSAAGVATLLVTVALQPGFAARRMLLLLALAAGSARLKVNLYKGSTLSFLTPIVLLAVIQDSPAVAVLVRSYP